MRGGLRWPGLLRPALAAASGAAAAAAFEPLGWSWLLPPAVAGCTLAVRGQRGRAAFGTGLLFGLGFMGLLLPWLRVIGTDAWLGLSLIEAAYYGLLGLLLGRLTRLRAWPLWTAAAWVTVEWLRSSVPWGGFPWGKLAFATVDTPLAPAMALLGPAGTTYVVALLGSLLAWLVVSVRGGSGVLQHRGLQALAVAACATLCVAPGLLQPLPDEAASGPDGAGPGGRSPGSLGVAAVQGDVPGEGMAAFAERRAVLDNHVGATLALASRIDRGDVPRPDVVLWPENSTDIDPFTDPTVYSGIQAAVDAVGVPTLVGAVVSGPGPVDARNQGIVWHPGVGPGDRYTKRHLVPFGEYIPMRAQLARLFTRLDQIPRDMVPGTTVGALDVAGTTLGDLICFEVADDALVRSVMDDGAELLVVQTNNATYMGTGQVEQQFAISRLRAIETGRYVVVVATNGVSGSIGPDGEVRSRAPVRQAAVLQDDLPLNAALTPASRLGEWPQNLLIALTASALLVGVMNERRSRPGPAAPARSGASPLAVSGARS